MSSDQKLLFLDTVDLQMAVAFIDSRVVSSTAVATAAGSLGITVVTALYSIPSSFGNPQQSLFGVSALSSVSSGSHFYIANGEDLLIQPIEESLRIEVSASVAFTVTANEFYGWYLLVAATVLTGNLEYRDGVKVFSRCQQQFPQPELPELTFLGALYWARALFFGKLYCLDDLNNGF